jgi:hypothetical protein
MRQKPGLLWPKALQRSLDLNEFLYPMDRSPSDRAVAGISRLSLVYDRIEGIDDDHTQYKKEKDQGDHCLTGIV